MATSGRRGRLTRRAVLGLGAGALALGGGAAVANLAGVPPAPAGPDVNALFGMRSSTGHRYADLPGRAGRVDVYRPQGPGPFPVVVWNAGSGWRDDRGYHDGQAVARGLVPHGYAVAAFSVRSSKQGRFPAQVEDATAAVRWVRAHAVELDLDASRLTVAGTSSGGWNALMAGLTGGRDLDRAHVPPPGREVPPEGHAIPEEDRVQAILDFFAPTDFLAMNAQMPPGACADYNRQRRLEHCHLDDHSTKSAMLGVPVLASDGLTRLASPIAHVRPDSPPMMIVHGLKDPTVPWRQSLELYEAAEAAGVRAAFYSVADAGHDLGMMGGGWGSAEVLRSGVPLSAVHATISWAAVAAFLDTVLPG